MQVDKQTFRDLEVFTSPDEGVCLFDLLNKTTTTGGKFALREKFLNPLGEIEKIRLVQDAVSYLSQNTDHWKLPFNDEKMRSLERYASSNIDPILDNGSMGVLFQSLQYYIIDRESYRYIKGSLIELVDYVDRMLNLFSKGSSAEIPILLNDIYKKLITFSIEPSYSLISKTIHDRKTLSLTQVFHYDGLLRGNSKQLLVSVIQLTYELDALFSMAKATIQFNLCFPEMIANGITRFEVEGLFHPMLENPKSYDFSIGEENNLIFLTGPNMAGKTTFLKSVGIAVYLAHIGMSVPANKMKTVLFDRFISSITINENIFKGYSYFFSEVKRVKQVAEALNQNEKIFVLFDELFKGTNVSDAYDASDLIISELVQWENSLFIISSHLFELEKELKRFPQINFFFFESEIVNGSPVFSYRLKKGVSDIRLGMVIIEQEKIMDLLKNQQKP